MPMAPSLPRCDGSTYPQAPAAATAPVPRPRERDMAPPAVLGQAGLAFPDIGAHLGDPTSRVARILTGTSRTNRTRPLRASLSCSTQSTTLTSPCSRARLQSTAAAAGRVQHHRRVWHACVGRRVDGCSRRLPDSRVPPGPVGGGAFLNEVEASAFDLITVGAATCDPTPAGRAAGDVGRLVAPVLHPTLRAGPFTV